MSYDVEHVASQLRQARAAKHVSQSEVAIKTGISEASLVKWENGKGRMTLTNAWKLADYYGVSLDGLFGRTVPAGGAANMAGAVRQ